MTRSTLSNPYYLAFLLLASLPAQVVGEDCPPEPEGRPSKATIRLLEERAACFRRLAAREATAPNLEGFLSLFMARATEDEKSAVKKAQETAQNAEATAQEAAAEATRKAIQHEVFDEFANGNWSLAFGELIRGVHITSADLAPGGIVRVTGRGDHDIQPIAVYSPSLWVRGAERDTTEPPRFGLGPMIVSSLGFLDPDSDSSWLLGAGVMLGVRTDSRGSSIGIGLGYALEQLPSLRDDFVPGEVAPLDPMGNPLEPLFEDRTKSAWLLAVSFSVGRAGQ